MNHFATYGVKANVKRRSTRRTRSLCLECLESRLALAGLTPGNIDGASGESSCDNLPVYVVVIPGFGYTSKSAPPIWATSYGADIKYYLERYTLISKVKVIDPPMWDSGNIAEATSSAGNATNAFVPLKTQAKTVANYVRSKLGTERLNLLVVGHSRGAVLANAMLEDLFQLGRPSNVNFVAEILLDPTAATKVYGDTYPSAKPAGVDYAMRLDDDQTLNPWFGANFVVDGKNISGVVDVRHVGERISDFIRKDNPIVWTVGGPLYAILSHQTITSTAYLNPSDNPRKAYPAVYAELGAFLLRADGRTSILTGGHVGPDGFPVPELGCVRIGSSGNANNSGRVIFDDSQPKRRQVSAGSSVNTANTFYNLAFDQNTTLSVRYVLNSKSTLDSAISLAQMNEPIEGGSVTTDWNFDVLLPADLAGGTYYLAVVATTTAGEEMVSDFAPYYVLADKFPPTITAPIADVVVAQDRPEGAVVEYPVSVYDDNDSAPALVADHPSGSVFPPGITVVNLTSTDRVGNKSQHSFRVIVTASPTVAGFQTPSTHVVGRRIGQVAAGDLNEDGYPDIVATNWLNKSISVELNQQNRQFAPPVFVAVGSSPQRLVLADLNRDNHLDLAVTNLLSDTVSVLLGDGRGNFGTQKSFVVGSLPTSITSGDFNGDGFRDLAVVNSGDGGLSGASTISVLIGVGDGSFQAARTFSSVGPIATSLVAADFNGDGKDDIAAVTNDDKVRLFAGDGNGTFTVGAVYTTPAAPFEVYASDLDGDSKLDLLTASSFGDANQVALFRGNGDGSFRSPSYFSVGQSPKFFVVGDFNADEKTDFAVTTADSMQFFRGRGNGTFENPLSMAAGGTSLADFDRDGSPDLAGPNPNALSNSIDVLYNLTNAPLQQLTGLNISGKQATAFQDLAVGHFSDPNVQAEPEDYKVIVDWGDTLISTGRVEPDPAGGFIVRASHVYADAGNYVVNVNVADAGKSFSFVSTATIDDIPPVFSDSDLTLSAETLLSRESIVLGGSFTNSSPTEEHLVIIDWGDGSGIEFLDLAFTDRSFQSSHKYEVSGSYQAIVVVSDYRGASVAKSNAISVNGRISVIPVSGLRTTEAGGTATFTVALDTLPTANVTIALSSSNLDEGTVSPATLTFTPTNGTTAQTVTITGVDDQIDDGDIVFNIITASAVSTDSNYNGLDAADAVVTNIDNETVIELPESQDLNELSVQGSSNPTVFRFEMKGRGTADHSLAFSPDTGKMLQLELRDANGKLLSKGLTGRQTLSLAGYGPGIYTVAVAGTGTDIINYSLEFRGQFTAGEPDLAGLDIDGDGLVNAVTENRLLNLYLAKFPASVIEQFRAPGATRTGVQIKQFLDSLGDALDFDGDGKINAVTESRLLNLYLAKFPASILDAFRGPNPVRTGTEIKARLDGLLKRATSTIASEGESVLSPIGMAPAMIDYLIAAIPLHNEALATDVNFDGFTTPADVLMIVNHLNDPAAGFSSPTFLDVDGNKLATPLDALQVINVLNGAVTNLIPAEGESANGARRDFVAETSDVAGDTPDSRYVVALAFDDLYGADARQSRTTHQDTPAPAPKPSKNSPSPRRDNLFQGLADSKMRSTSIDGVYRRIRDRHSSDQDLEAVDQIFAQIDVLNR